MKTTPASTITESPLWVEVSAPDFPRYWARASRMLAEVPDPEKSTLLEKLKAGTEICFEASNIHMKRKPMSATDCRRLKHLLGFEEGGFQLAAFRQAIALFSKENQDYHSMTEMAEQGFLPNHAIAISRRNTMVTNFHGQLLDVFVPVSDAPSNFFFVSPERPMQSS